jgi:hypothetical protein
MSSCQPSKMMFRRPKDSPRLGVKKYREQIKPIQNVFPNRNLSLFPLRRHLGFRFQCKLPPFLPLSHSLTNKPTDRRKQLQHPIHQNRLHNIHGAKSRHWNRRRDRCWHHRFPYYYFDCCSEEKEHKKKTEGGV